MSRDAPDQFGEWPTYEEGPYSEIPESGQLFDREVSQTPSRGTCR